MKHLLFPAAIALATTLTGTAQDNPGWARSTLSPDQAVAKLSQIGGDRSISIVSTEEPAPLSEVEASASLGLASPPATAYATTNATPGGNEADEITPEIAALARGLRNDPVKIFEYVHNYIRFEAYFGSKKGAHLTMLEGGGNEHDQCALLVSLLRAAGQNPTYKYGPCTFSYSQMAQWFGLSSSPFSHWTNAQMLSYYYPSGGAPAGFPTTTNRQFLTIYEFLTRRGYPYVDAFVQSGIAYCSIPHVWVELGGKKLSPAYKNQTFHSGIDLATAAGYSRSQILTDVGGTVNTDGGTRWVSGLNYSVLTDRLKTYTQNFIQAVKANNDGLHSDQITEYSTINKATYATLDNVTPIFPDSYAAAQWLPFETWSAIPVAHMSKLAISAGVWNGTSWTSTYFNQSLNLPGLRGRKLSLTYSGNTGSIYLDESLVGGATFAIPSGKTDIDLRLGITHNHYQLQWNGSAYAVTNAGEDDQSETKKYLKGDDCAYALVYSFSNPERLSRVRQESLDAYRRAGLTDSDWQVRTESLNIIGLNWMHQCHQAGNVIAGLYDVLPLNHHEFGRVGQERSFATGAISFYIDVGLVFSADYHRTSNFAEANNYEELTMPYYSAMEHGVLEQMQGTGLGATSTVKMIYLANQANQRIYRATGANWSSVTPELANYPGTVLSSIGTALAADSQSHALLPASGQQVLNQYKGFGYALNTPETISMIIGSNFGGYNSQPASVSSDDLITWIRSDASYLSGSSDLAVPAAPLTIPKASFGDPVDVATGAWISDSADLVLGRGAPNGLAFVRSYNSNAAFSNSSGLGYGWTHNYDISATQRSSVNACLGGTTTYQAAPFYAALAVAYDMARQQTGAREWATSMLAAHWAVDQMRYKSVAITTGNQTMEFIEMPDGSYASPAGMDLTLVKNAGNFELTKRHGATMFFLADGKLDKIVDLAGNTQQFTYNAGKLMQVSDSFSRTLNFSWVGQKITAVTDSTSRSVGFGYSGDDLTSATDAEGKTMTYGYDGSHRVTWVKDAMARTTIENDYDAKGRVITQRNQGDPSRTYNIYYSGYCNIEEDPLGGTKSYFYDARGRTIGGKNALGQSDISQYDGQDRRIYHITPKNERIDWYYDSDNNLTDEQDELGEWTDYYYDTQLRLQEVIDKNWNSTTFTHTARHQLESVTDPLNHVTSYTYLSNGLPATVTDGENKTTTTEYDAWGSPNKIIYHDSTFASMTNNARGDVLTATDPEGRTVTNTYNARRQLLTNTQPAIPGEPAAVTSLAYDNAGNLQSTMDAKGNVTSQTSNALGNHLTTTLPALPAGNNVVTSAYDLRDWLTGTTDSLGHAATTEYDSAHRPTATIDSLNRRTENTFDANGRPIQSKDALNRITQQAWTTRGEKMSSTDALNKNTNSVFDSNGNLTWLTNRRGKAYHFVVDYANRPISTSTPTGKSTLMTYFNNNKVKTIQEPSGQTTTLTYNGRNHVQTKADPTGTITYEYDNSGLLKTVTEGSSVITRTYNERGCLKTFANADGDILQYRYDSNGNLARIIYPDLKQVNYIYNSRNLLETVTDWSSRVTTYQYDRIGRLTGIVRPNGTSATIASDAAGQILSIRDGKAGSLFNYIQFGYDSAGQITSRFQAPMVNSSWHHPPFSGTYDDDNRLLTVNGTGVTHDDDGNMTYGPIAPTTGSVALTYNSRNQLLTAGGISYTYDAEGRRRTSVDSGGTTRYTIDAARQSLLVKHNPGGTQTRYVYGLGLLYEVDETEHTKTYHFDQVGSTVARTDDNGKVIGRASYSAFGLMTSHEGEMTTPFLYNGQSGVFTEANGLLNMRARYYSPYLMRFLNADPSGFSGGANWFSYADGNPISLSDPFGLCAEANACTGGYGKGSATSMPTPQWVENTINSVSAVWNVLNPPTPQGMVVMDMGILGLFNPVGEVGALSETFEIIDGVRRAKAASMLGKTSVSAEIYDTSGATLLGKQDVLLESLFSPNKGVINVNNLTDIERFASIHEATLKGATLPPIKVTSGSGGFPVSKIIFNYGR